jgi:hypothetical protein
VSVALSASIAGWIAIGALVVALASTAVAALAFASLRRVRAGQAVLLGGARADLVDFAVSLQGRIDDVHNAMDEIASAVARVDQRVDGSVSRHAIVRYDAIEGTGVGLACPA